MTLDEFIPAVREHIPDVAIQLTQEQLLDDERPVAIFALGSHTVSIGPRVNLDAELVAWLASELLPL
jgi:hypothetical protein